MKNKKIGKIRFRPSLFWDVDPKTIDQKKHAWYIVERILDFGNDDEVRWAVKKYPKSLFKQIVVKSRGLMPTTRNLWSLLLKQKN